METIHYIIIAILLAVFVGPALFADRSPIPETSGKVHKITTLAELTTLLSRNTYVLIDFYADWCPPCRAIAPVFSKLADEHAVDAKLAFAKVNVDHVKDVAGMYDVRAMPTFLIIKDGKKSEVALKDAGGKEGKETVVDKVQGANVVLLKSVVYALAEKVSG